MAANIEEQDQHPEVEDQGQVQNPITTEDTIDITIHATKNMSYLNIIALLTLFGLLHYAINCYSTLYIIIKWATALCIYG